MNDLHHMREEHSTLSDKMIAMEKQNQSLWQEVVNLKKQNSEQQWRIHQILQFIARLVQPEQALGPPHKRPRLALGQDTQRAIVEELPIDPLHDLTADADLPPMPAPAEGADNLALTRKLNSV